MLRVTVLKHAEEVESYEEELLQKSERVDELTQKTCAMEAATIQMIQEKEKTHDVLIKNKADVISKLQGEVVKKDQELYKLGEEVSCLLKQIADLEQEVSLGKSNTDALLVCRKELDNAHAREAKLAKEASEAAEALSVFEERLEQLKADNELQTKATTEHLAQSDREAREHLESTMDELSSAQSEIQSLRIEAASVGSLKARLHVLETQVSGHKPLEQKLRQELSELQVREAACIAHAERERARVLELEAQAELWKAREVEWQAEARQIPVLKVRILLDS